MHKYLLNEDCVYPNKGKLSTEAKQLTVTRTDRETDRQTDKHENLHSKVYLTKTDP